MENTKHVPYIGETIQFANNLLIQASIEGMITEVVVWSLSAMKNNPNLSIEEAIEYSIKDNEEG